MWRQRTGLQSWAASRFSQSAAVVWARASTLARTGSSASRRSAFGQRLAQPVPGRGHERGVEGAADLERQDPAGAQLLGVLAGGLDGLGGAGDDHLAGGVVVGHPDVTVGPGAGDGDVVVVEGDDRGHGPGPLGGGDLHGLAPLGDQLRPRRRTTARRRR